ncbi:MAG: hypothetical protein LUH40_07560 [Clostridiales bacterium]|nr:hypothetical protein [Clostridiales bacterium]
MKKSEIAMQYKFKGTEMFIAAAIALTVNAVLSFIVNAAENMPFAVSIIAQLLAVAFTLFAYIITIKGFSVLDKACRLSEENENYYMGKNLKSLSIASFVITVVGGIAAVIFSVILSVYSNAESLTDSDRAAAANVSVITAIILVALQAAAISTVYIIYLWKLRSFSRKSDFVSNFALLTAIVFAVQLVIGIMSTVYTFRGNSSFLNTFSSILLVVKYILLLAFLIVRRRSFASADSETQTDENDVGTDTDREASDSPDNM